MTFDTKYSAPRDLLRESADEIDENFIDNIELVEVTDQEILDVLDCLVADAPPDEADLTAAQATLDQAISDVARLEIELRAALDAEQAARRELNEAMAEAVRCRGVGNE